MSFSVDADIVLRSEFHRGFGLAPHHGAHMRLRYAHHPAAHTVPVPVGHLLLPPAQSADGVQHPGLAAGGTPPTCQKGFDESGIAGKCEQQPAHQGAHLVCGTPLRLGHPEVRLAERLPACARMAPALCRHLAVEDVDDFIGLLPRLVEQ